MLKIVEGLTRQHKARIFLALDLILLPVALLFTFVLQELPVAPLALLGQMLPVLPYLLLLTAGLSYWLGLPQVQLIAYERHAVCQTAILAGVAALAEAALCALFGPELPLGVHVVFGLSYLLMMVAARAVMLQLVLALYRRARSGRGC